MPQCIGEYHNGDRGSRCERPTVNDPHFCAHHGQGERGESPASGGGDSSEGGDERRGEAGMGGGRDRDVVWLSSRRQRSQGEEPDGSVRTNRIGPTLPGIMRTGNSRDVLSDSVWGERLRTVREPEGADGEEEKQGINPQGEIGPCPRAGATVRETTRRFARVSHCCAATHRPSTLPL